MDNNIYEPVRERNRRKQPQNKQSFMTKVIAVQLVMSLLISGILFAVCRTDSNLSKNIKLFYSEICQTDIAVSTIFGTFKNVVKQTFAPTLPEKENVDKIAGETNDKSSGERAVFSPVFLTVNLQNPMKEGSITSHFGYRVSPITDKYSLHTGLDIAAPENSKIYSAYDGIVEKADNHKINGNYIVIKHSDTIKTTYNHCNKLLVQAGEEIKKGTCIALVGKTGYATGFHLHFEVLVNNKYINPVWVIDYGVYC